MFNTELGTWQASKKWYLWLFVGYLELTERPMVQEQRKGNWSLK